MTCCIGDSAFCDEGQTHDEVNRTVLSFFCVPAVAEDRSGECNGKRRNHTADHNGSHDLESRIGRIGRCACEQSGCGNVSCLVERTAHINCHHACKQCANGDEQSGLRSHRGYGVLHAVIDQTHDRVDSAHHDADNAKSAQRIDQDGLDAFESVRQMFARFFEHFEQPAAEEACKQRTEETGGDSVNSGRVGKGRAGRCQRTADDTDQKTRTVCNRNGDKAC